MVKTRRTNAQWQTLISECEASGQTQEEWCITKGINLYTYRDRARRLRKTQFSAGKIKDKKQPQAGKAAIETVSAAKWLEVKPECNDPNGSGTENPQTSGSNGKLTIETGKLKITVDAAYPMTVLTGLLRELASIC